MPTLLCAIALLCGNALGAAPPARDFIRFKEIDGVSWLIAPDGQRFVSIGLNHFNAGFLTAPQNAEFMAKKYGGDIYTTDHRVNEHSQALAKWFDDISGNMKAWGFNSFGMHVGREIPLDLYRNKAFYLAWLKPVPLDGWAAVTKYPDVFSPQVEQAVDAYVGAETQKYKDDVNVLGYCYCDVPKWVVIEKGGPDTRTYPWVRAIRSLASAAPGKQAYLAFLKQKHSDIATFNAVHGTAASTWDGIASLTDWPAPADAARAMHEDEAFAAQIADRWYGMQYHSLRTHDPHHLIFGDKLSFNVSPEAQRFLYPALAKYVDVILIQYYGDHPPVAAALRELHKKTGKPILNGDSSFAFPNPNQARSKGVKVASYQEVGEHYTRYLQDILAEPFMVGWHYCGYMEGWSGAGKALESQSGLVDPFDHPYADAVTLVSQANAKATEWHRRSTGARK